MIPYSRHKLFKDDISAVNKVLRSNYLTTGPEVEIFEKNLEKKFFSKYSTCVNSATSALHLACIAIGLKSGDFLWTSAISFVASSNCGLYCGAKIDLLDIDSNTFNISVKNLEKKLKEAKKKNCLPKVIVVVHFAGNPCDMKTLHFFSKKYNFKIIEDASHASGSYYRKEIIGNCKYSDVCVFSLHPVKIFTAGEGGVLLTNNKEINRKVKILRSHGIEKNPKKFVNKNKSGWYYEQQLLGLNYRMTDIQAALGNSQLKKVDLFIHERNKIIKFYKDNLKNLPITFQAVDGYDFSSYHLGIIIFKDNKTREKIFRLMRSENFFVNLHYIPIYRHPYYKKFKINRSNYPNSELFYKRALSIPIYYGLKKSNILKFIKILKNSL
mgnify:FL=1